MKTLATPILLIALATGSWGILAQERELPVNASISREALRSVTKGTDDRFTGNARITSLFPANAPSRVTGGQVTFESDARTAWHAHPVGQTLIVTAGTGRIQFWGTSWRPEQSFCGPMLRAGQYNLDHFSGTIDPTLQEFQSVNNDGGRSVNDPTVFRRVRCLEQPPVARLSVAPPPFAPPRRAAGCSRR